MSSSVDCLLEVDFDLSLTDPWILILKGVKSVLVNNLSTTCQI